MQTVCCSSGEWYHKRCLKERANHLQGVFACPCCGNTDLFRDNMLSNGIYISENNGLALYQSIGGDNDIELAPPQKKRRFSKDYIYEKTFKTKAESDRF